MFLPMRRGRVIQGMALLPFHASPCFTSNLTCAHAFNMRRRPTKNVRGGQCQLWLRPRMTARCQDLQAQILPLEIKAIFAAPRVSTACRMHASAFFLGSVPRSLFTSLFLMRCACLSRAIRTVCIRQTLLFLGHFSQVSQTDHGFVVPPALLLCFRYPIETGMDICVNQIFYSSDFDLHLLVQSPYVACSPKCAHPFISIFLEIQTSLWLHAC